MGDGENSERSRRQGWRDRSEFLAGAGSRALRARDTEMQRQRGRGIRRLPDLRLGALLRLGGVTRRRLSLRPRDATARPLIEETEYEEWSRGRVGCGRPSDLFVIYAARQALPYRALIEARFVLLPGHTAMRKDNHYRSTRLIVPAPGSPA